MKFLKKLIIVVIATSIRSINADDQTNINFTRAVDISHGTVYGVSSLDAQDIDKDGLMDVAVLEGGKHATAKTCAWFESATGSQNDWTCHEFNSIAPLKSFLGSVKLVDIDNDNDFDLVVSSDNHSGEIKDTDIFVFVNPLPNGDVYAVWDFFYVARRLPYHHINDMEVADMDNDGKTDIVVRSLEPNEIHIFFQNDLFSWEKKSIVTNLDQSEGLAVGDLDGDDRPEISFTGFLLRSPAQPRIEEYTRLAVDSIYHAINQNTKEAIGDIDADGFDDILLAPAEKYRNGKDHDLAWYKNPGGDLTAPWMKTVVLAATNDMHTVKLADMNGDGALDIVGGIAWGEKSVNIFFNDGQGTFSQRQIVCTGKGLYSGVVIDFDSDGDIDIIGQDTYANESKPYLYESLMEK